MKPILLILVLIASMTALWAQQQPSGTEAKSVATTWPGIQYEVFAVQRIAVDRFIVAVKVAATAQAPETTFIGIEHKIPPNASPAEIGTGKYRPDPFSIDAAIMTDEITKQTFSPVEPAPNGPGYPPSGVMANLNRGEVRILSVQFPVPPPPPPPPGGGTPPKQTVSILLPNARGPITKITIPPAPAPAAAH